MTICIAAFVGDKYIVTASDRKLSTGTYSADGLARKNKPIAGWRMMYSASDVGLVTPIIDQFRELMHSTERDQRNIQNVTASATAAYQSARIRRVEQTILAPYGLAMGDFLSRGRDMFSDSVYVDLCRRIESANINCEFLLCGFDPIEMAPHLLSVESGVASIHDEEGFYAIGSGSYLALSNLYIRDYLPERATLQECIYRICEAKFLAEYADGVGKATTVGVYRPGTDIGIYLSPDDLGKLRNAWEANRREPIPTAGMNTALQIVEAVKQEQDAATSASLPSEP